MLRQSPENVCLKMLLKDCRFGFIGAMWMPPETSRLFLWLRVPGPVHCDWS
jgi:hypothetical protein